MDEPPAANGDTDEPPAGSRESIWRTDGERPTYEPLDCGVTVDTAVVGAGIVGTTAAARLADAGQSVAVLERDRVGSGTTGHSTAKLTALHGLVYDRLRETFDERTARRYADANLTAIEEVAATVADRDIDCEFRRTTAYTYVRSPGERHRIVSEVRAGREAGLPASLVESTDLPYDVEAAVAVEKQAQFDPRQYVLGLAASLPERCHVFEGTGATDLDRGRRRRHVVTDRGTVTAEDVVVATRIPVFDPGFHFARVTPKRSYVLAARLAEPAPEGMYYRQSDPYFSVRPSPRGDERLVLLGGQNHRTGHGGPTIERYRKLERAARRKFDVEDIVARWSTQDVAAVDGVPFVGRLAPHTDHVYGATGFGGWGLSNGVAAGVLLADLVLGRENPWKTLYRPTRFTPRASLERFVEHNGRTAGRFLADRLGGTKRRPLRALDPGEADVLEGRSGPVAAYRDDEGELHAVSAVCPHMGCTVEWNDAERSWDCPCHGSRFDPDGTVLDPPATEPLSDRDPDGG